MTSRRTMKSISSRESNLKNKIAEKNAIYEVTWQTESAM